MHLNNNKIKTQATVDANEWEVGIYNLSKYT